MPTISTLLYVTALELIGVCACIQLTTLLGDTITLPECINTHRITSLT